MAENIMPGETGGIPDWLNMGGGGPINIDWDQLREIFGVPLTGRTTGTGLQRLVAMQILPLLLQRLKTQGGLESQISQGINRLTPGSRQGVVDEFSNKVRTNAAETGKQAGLALEGAGYGSGLSGSAITGAFGDSQAEINDFVRSMNSPDWIQKLMGLAGDNPYMSSFGALAGANAPPKPAEAPDPFMGLLGSAIGGLAGNPNLGNIFR